MKKVILTSLLVAIVSVASAATFTCQSFVNANSISVTNTIGVTNLSSYPTIGIGTNYVGTVYTNLAGTKITVGSTIITNAVVGVSTNYTYVGDNVNLLKDVSLWGDGTPMQRVWAVSTGTNATVQAGPYIGNIFIRVVGEANADQACVFTFVPVPDGINEDTVAGDAIAISVTPSGATQVCSMTPLDAYKLIGCKALRLRTITGGDADATSRLHILECTFNSFVP